MRSVLRSGTSALTLIVGCSAASTQGPPEAKTAPIVAAPTPLSAPSARRQESRPSPLDEGELRARLSAFYRSLGDAVQRRQAYQHFFAPKLERFINEREVTRERALALAEAFFLGKTEIVYTLIGTPRVTRDGAQKRVAANVSGHLKRPVPERWPNLVPELAEQEISTKLDLAVELEVGGDGAVTSYSERDARASHHMRVTIETRGYELPFVEGCWAKPQEELASIALPVGTVLEVTGESVAFFGCGPPSTVEHLRLGGRDLWVALARYELAPNPAGGNSLGGRTFLEWAP